MADTATNTTANATASAGGSASSGDLDQGTLIAYIAIGILAILPIYIGSYASVKFWKPKKPRRQRSRKDSDSEDEEDAADGTPVVGSVTLFSMYLVLKFVSKEIINLVLTVNFVLMGIAALYGVILGAARWTTGWKLAGDVVLSMTKKKEELFYLRFGYIHILFFALASAVGSLYAYNKHWILSNLIGESLSIGAIQLLNLDSFATGMMLLAGLFFYDVFWVFGTEVMVTVAKGLDVPIKVVFPRDVAAVVQQGLWNKPTGVPFSMLGLGDIVIPGIFVALCLNYDYHRYLQSPKGKKNKGSRWFPTPYFTTCFIMYILGLVLTIYVMHTFKAAQPALLYLSPACILSALGVATVLGDLKGLFDFAPDGSPASDKKKEEEEAAKSKKDDKKKEGGKKGKKGSNNAESEVPASPPDTTSNGADETEGGATDTTAPKSKKKKGSSASATPAPDGGEGRGQTEA
ncbi:signal peptide peptidase-domain-containing protein [Zopfochytrium polystomum]|nr:signal peptide peptidase-domain-containing protein [Zopfochytrium polystomum]